MCVVDAVLWIDFSLHVQNKLKPVKITATSTLETRTEVRATFLKLLQRICNCDLGSTDLNCFKKKKEEVSEKQQKQHACLLKQKQEC